MSRRRNTTFSITVAVIIAILGYFMKSSPTQLVRSISIARPSPTLPKPTYPPTIHRVTEVIDGDTVKIDTGQKVRYIGIDTPEIHAQKNKSTCFGQEAKKMNESLVSGKLVELKKDVSEVDRYGRLLRFIYVYDEVASQEGTFVNDYLVEKGYARAATFPPDVSLSEHFVALQEAARKSNSGLWSACDH